MALTISVILSFFAVRGFRFEITEEGLVLRNTETFLWLLLFVLFSYVLYRSFKDPDRHRKGYSLLFGVIVSLFYILGMSFEKAGTLTVLWNNTETLANYLNLFYSCAVLFFCFSYIAFGLLAGQDPSRALSAKKAYSFGHVLLFWGLLLLFYVPWYLYCYPGILTQDSDDQIRQALFLKELSSHHSVFLTLMIRLVMTAVRSLTGSLQAGVGACSLLQMLVMTFIFAAAYVRIRSYLTHPVTRLLAFLWYAVYPVHAFYSVTMWKDILFSGGVLVLTLCMDDAVRDEAAFFSSGRKKLILFLILFLLPLMRHNGIALTLLVIIGMLFRFPRFQWQTLILCGGSLILFGVWNFLVLPALHVEAVESGLGLSVLTQQIARTLSVHHDELSDYELSALEEYFDVPEIWGRYKPTLSDPVKNHFREDVFSRNPRRFLSLWARLGMRYPLDYIEAFLHNNYGYWFPETGTAIPTPGVFLYEELGDIRYAPLLKTEFMDRYCADNARGQYMKLPVLPLLFSPGACFWVWLFCGIFCLYRNREKFLVLLPGFALWLSVLISPMYGEMRYIYGLFIALPLVMASSLTILPVRQETKTRSAERASAL